MRFGKHSDADKPLPWWRRSAPPPFGWPLAGAYALMLAPAILGALLHWLWAVTVALVIPGFSVLTTLGFVAGRAHRGQTYEQMLPTRTRMKLGALTGLVCFVSVNVRPAYLVPLAFVLVTTIIVDPLWRIAFKRASQA